MKATAHWLELKGYTPKSPSTHFDEVFTAQVMSGGRIEEGGIIRGFFQRTGQPLLQDWLIEVVRRLVAHLPVRLLIRMGLANVLKPRTRNWTAAAAALRDHVEAERRRQHRELGLDELIALAAGELEGRHG